MRDGRSPRTSFRDVLNARETLYLLTWIMYNYSNYSGPLGREEPSVDKGGSDTAP